MRAWTDHNGRNLQASLISAFKNSDGVFEGIFEKPNGETFSYVIGKLSSDDVELVKRALKHNELNEAQSVQKP